MDVDMDMDIDIDFEATDQEDPHAVYHMDGRSIHIHHLLTRDLDP